MNNSRKVIQKIMLIFAGIFLLVVKSQAEVKENKFGSFSFEQKVNLPGKPEIIYDAITGDISGWWDHSFSEKPYKFYIDAKPGGGFYEIYNQSGDGVKHATVIIADRGKMLRFDGPLGLSGMAIQVVTTYTFESISDDSTSLKLSVHAAGEIKDGLPEIVEGVWHHFIFEQFKPYVEAGKHLK